MEKQVLEQQKEQNLNPKNKMPKEEKQKTESKEMEEVVENPKKEFQEIEREKEESKEKIILVDAVHCLVDEKGNVNEELKNYLDSIKNKKIVITNAQKDKHELIFHDIKNYEIFSLENNPPKKNSEYYKIFLKKFNLIPEQVIYFEHDEEGVKSAKSVGIKAVHYKDNIKEIKEFIEENIKTKDKPTSKEPKKEESKEKKSVETKLKAKKTEAVVNITSLPISTKHSTFVCKFIKGKKIEDAIKDLEKVVLLKKPVPMKGEIPHRKGMMSGRYPKKTAEHFIKFLNVLSANANVNGLENTII